MPTTAAPLRPHQRHPVPPTPSARYIPPLRVEIDHRAGMLGRGAEIGFAPTEAFGVLPGRLP